MIEVKVTGVPEGSTLKFRAYAYPHTAAEFERVLEDAGVKPEPVDHDPTQLRLVVGDGEIRVFAPSAIEPIAPQPRDTPRAQFIDRYLEKAGDES